MRQERRNGIQPRENSLPDTFAPDTYVQSKPGGIDLRDLLSICLRWRWVMLGTLAAVFAAGMAYTLTRRPVYESSAKIVVFTRTGGMSVPTDDIPLLSDLQALTRSRSVVTQAEIISSRDILDEAWKALSPKARSSGFGGDSLPGWACSISAKKDTDIINVTGRAYNPAAAAELANTIANTYFERDLKLNNRATRQAREYAEEKMVIAEKELAQANVELSRFKRATGLFSPDVQLTKTAEQMAELSFGLDTAKADAAARRRQASVIRRELAGHEQSVAASTTMARNPQFNAILAKIDELNSKRAELLGEYTPQSREIKQIDERIEHEEQSLKKVAETIVGSTVHTRNPVRDQLTAKFANDTAAAAAAEARTRALKAELATRERTAKSLPEYERHYTELVQRAALLQRTHEMLSGKYYALLLSEQAMLPNGMLVSTARVSDAPAYPKPKRSALLFFMLGVALAVAAAAVAERLDARVHDQTVIEQASGLPTLSLVPNSVENPHLLGADGHNLALVESYRILRNNISFANVEQQIKLLAVTSPGRGEGKSTTVLNLGLAMAMEGKRILLVDGDLRRPSLHRFVGVPRSAGLTTVLMGGSTLEESIVTVREDNVFCLPSGPTPPNPAEMLNSRPCRELLKSLPDQYDLVLLDCPPATGFSDIQVVSTLADGILLVVSMDQTLKPQLDMAMRTLNQADAPLIGVVLNRVDVQGRRYGYYYYYYSSYHDYAQDEDKSEAGAAPTHSGGGS